MKPRQWEIGKEYETVGGDMLECIGVRRDGRPVFEGPSAGLYIYYTIDGLYHGSSKGRDIKPERELVYVSFYPGSTQTRNSLTNIHQARGHKCLWTEERDLNDPAYLRIVWSKGD